MTREDAIATAMSVARQKQWPWLEPVTAARRRRYWLVGGFVWHVLTHSKARGGNIRVGIDADSGKVIYAGLSPK